MIKSEAPVAAAATQGGSLRDYARRAFDLYPDRKAFVSDDVTLHFGELGERVFRLSSLIDSLGVSASGKVGIAASFLPDFLYEMRLATYEHGAALFGVAATMGRWPLIEALRSVGPEVVFYDEHFTPDLPHVIREALPNTRAIAARGPRGDYEGLLQTVSPVPSTNLIAPESLAAIGYSSGTTGPPKGVTATHGALGESARMLLESLPGLTSEVRGFYDCVPLFAAGGGMIVPALAGGLTLYVPSRFSAEDALRSIEANRIEYLFVTPSMLIDILDSPGLDKANLSSLKAVIYGSASMPAAKLEEALHRIGPVLMQGYGMSELLPPVTVLSPEDHGSPKAPALRNVLSSAGRPVPGVRVRIESEEGEILGAMEIGEVVIHSKTMTKGYWKDPERTASSMRHGWWRSGDVGFLDRDGLLHILDRKQDLITRGARTLYPRDIEEVLSQHPMVKEVCVVQDATSLRVVAAVSLRRAHRGIQSEEEHQAELRAFLSARIDAGSLPDEVRLFEELPRSLQGKVLKREIRDVISRAE